MKKMILFILVFSFTLPLWALSIYGKIDTRKNLSLSSNEEQLTALSTAVAVRRKYFLNPSTDFPSSKERFNLCAKEVFSKEPSIASCSGILIDHDKILTARHCIKSQYDCNKYQWVFDYDDIHLNLENPSLDHLEQVQCTKILYSSPGLDLTIIEIDQKLSRPLVQLDIELNPEHLSYLIGSPVGVPLKVSPVQKFSHELDGFWSINVDAFNGQSGSGIYSKSHHLMGVLTAGSEDYFYNDQLGCREFFRCQFHGMCDGEIMIPHSSFPSEMKEFFFHD
jgi:hypothetical protein